MEERSEMDRYLSQLIVDLYIDLNRTVDKDEQTTQPSTGEDLDLSYIYGTTCKRRSTGK